MRAVVQRVQNASVSIHGEIVSSINTGLLVYLGIKCDDTKEDTDYIISKILNLRIFEDSNGVPNLSATETENEILVISQFTLYGDARHGRRPSYIDAGKPENAKPVYDEFILKMQAQYPKISTGIFQEEMAVHSVNDGPFTILLDSRKEF